MLAFGLRPASVMVAVGVAGSQPRRARAAHAM
jgi:hypothetical protein